MDRVLFWNGKIIKRHHVRDPAWDMRLDGRSNLQLISLTMTIKTLQDFFLLLPFLFCFVMKSA